MKIYVTLLFSFIILTCISCRQLNVSEKEAAAINEIANLYGGTCTYAINLTASTKYGNTKTFEIEVSDSDFLNENAKWAEMFAANIAYVFFTFIKEEKKNTVALRVQLFIEMAKK